MVDFENTSVPNLTSNGKNYRFNGKIISNAEVKKC